MATEDRKVNLIINKLSKAQYEGITPEELELYLTPDSTEDDIAEAIRVHNTSNSTHQDIRNAIPEIVNNVTSTDTNKALSANMGKDLSDRIANVESRGRYLSLWNCVTGLAQTVPTVDPYPYKKGDYFIVGTVASASGTNYKPTGTQYSTSTPSTEVETHAVKVNDMYLFDGIVWSYLNTADKDVSFASLAGDPYDNTSLASALNNKYDASNPDGFQDASQVSGAISTHNNSTTAHSTQFATKQPNLTSANAGTGISITGSGANVVIANTQTSAEWGNITGDITDQDDLQTALSGKATSAQGAKADSAIQGVQINGTDLTKDANNKVEIPMVGGTQDTAGVVWTTMSQGLQYGQTSTSKGRLEIYAAQENHLIAKTQNYTPVVPAKLDIAVREGLGNNALTWSNAYKQSARNTIGATRVTLEDID